MPRSTAILDAPSTTQCPPWCVSTHHGEGPGQLDPELHHYSPTISSPNVVVDLEQTGAARPLMLLTNPDDHSELRVPADQADQLIKAMCAMVTTARRTGTA